MDDPDRETYDGLNRPFEYDFDRLGRQIAISILTMRRPTGLGVKYNHLDTAVWDKYRYDNLRRLTGVEYGSDSGVALLMDFVGDVHFAANVGGFAYVIRDYFLGLWPERVDSRTQIDG